MKQCHNEECRAQLNTITSTISDARNFVLAAIISLREQLVKTEIERESVRLLHTFFVDNGRQPTKEELCRLGWCFGFCTTHNIIDTNVDLAVPFVQKETPMVSPGWSH